MKQAWDWFFPSCAEGEVILPDVFADLQVVYDTERYLLYVACTRARDHLLVTSGDAPSEFLDDMKT